MNRESLGVGGQHQQLGPYFISDKKLKEISKAGSWSN